VRHARHLRPLVCRAQSTQRNRGSVAGASGNLLRTQCPHAACPTTYQTTMTLSGTPNSQATK
jgi:hypothetical protein